MVWRSISFWTRWSERTRQRAALRDQENRRHLVLQLAELEERLLLHQQEMFRRQLLQAMRPLAEALSRQDSLRQEQQTELRELLLEVLQSTHSSPLPPPSLSPPPLI